LEKCSEAKIKAVIYNSGYIIPDGLGTETQDTAANTK
jgi:hypothetical protein